MAEVFVVDRQAMFAGTWPQGFLPAAGAAGAALLEDAFRRGRFVDREVAERAPAWKQWIPYCLLRCVGATSEDGSNPIVHGIFRVRRSKGQTEARLHGLWSIGLGGHVDPEDRPVDAESDSGAAFFARALQRELHEELHLTLPPGTAPSSWACSTTTAPRSARCTPASSTASTCPCRWRSPSNPCGSVKSRRCPGGLGPLSTFEFCGKIGPSSKRGRSCWWMLE